MNGHFQDKELVILTIILKPRVTLLTEAWAPPLGKLPKRRKGAFKVQVKSPEQKQCQVK